MAKAMKSGKGGHGKGKGAPSGNRQPPDGGVRQSQTILTYGPGAMVDLLNDAVLVGGLDFWCYKGEEALYGFDEPRLRRHLRKRPGGLNEEAAFRLPPEADEHDPTRWRGIQVLEFPRWFVCQNPDCRRLACLGGPGSDMKDDRYIHRCLPDPKKYAFFTPVRFVVACVNGHIDDFPWGRFVHHADDCQAKTELRLDEGATGDFSELKVTCISCKRSRPLLEATFEESHPACQAKRPWLNDTDPRGCQENMRLLVRTASNAYFAQMTSALTIPEPPSVRAAVRSQFNILKAATAHTLPAFMTIPQVGRALQGFTQEQILKAIHDENNNILEQVDSLRTAEFRQFVSSAVEQLGEQPKAAEEFFARRLVPGSQGHPKHIQQVVLAHRLREVRVQLGFTRFEACTPDLQGEFPESDLQIKLAALGQNTDWLPGIIIRGEGFFIQLAEDDVREWEQRAAVQQRARVLFEGHRLWKGHSPAGSVPDFYGARFYLLHTLAHLLIQAVSLECGYSASAIRERIYCAGASDDHPMAAILLSTGTTGAEGTLGGLVEQGRWFSEHLRRACELGVLCSNDPVCASHDPSHDPTQRYLEGAACHGCLFIAEPSCERQNHFLDRALVFRIPGHEDVAFFEDPPA